MTKGKRMSIEAKTVDESRVETVHIVRPNHLNGANRLFGGILMQWIDEVAGIVAIRHAGTTVTTAAIDNLQFKAPAYQGEVVVLQGMVTYVGRSSMEIRVDTYREELDGKRTMINRAYIDMVAINDKGEAVEVPGLLIETQEQEEEHKAAQKRKQMRKARRLEGF